MHLTVDSGMFAAAVRACGMSAGTDKNLPAFCAMSLTRTAQGLELATTDRYRIGVATVPASEPHAGDDVQVLLPASALVSFAKRIKIERRKGHFVAGSDVADIAWDAHTCTIRALGMSQTFDVVEGDFPNYRKLIDQPHTPAGCTESCWNPAFLADAATACGIMSASAATPVVFTLVNPAKPALFRPNVTLGDGVEFVHLLMPVRLP